MTVSIDPRAIVHPTAKLAEGVSIGPFAIIGEEVTIGVSTSIGAHTVIERWTTIGARCRIGTGAVLGGAPQHLQYDGSPSYLHLPIRPINFPLSEFQAARREQHPIPAVAGCPSVTLTRV